MKDIKKLVLFALFAALACVATMSIKIPTPGTGGYIHPGDAVVILSGVFLGPVGGFLAAGIGSAMADLLGGYFIYVPVTFLIKGIIALLTAYVYRALAKDSRIRQYIAVGIGGIIDILFVVIGYGLFSTITSGIGSAVTSIIPNIIQGTGGLIIALILYAALSSVPEFRRMSISSAK